MYVYSEYVHLFIFFTIASYTLQNVVQAGTFINLLLLLFIYLLFHSLIFFLNYK